MANRPVYIVKDNIEFVKKVDVEFEWYSGFAIVQKQKSIESLHAKFLESHENYKILEVSSKSKEEIGIKLSAFNLTITHKISKEIFSVESAFQSSKVFEKGGPFIDLREKTSKEAKQDLRLKTSGDLIYFKFFNSKWPLEPKTLFYDWLYINALSQNKELAEASLEYNAFTDIEFNPKRSINCQAKALALYISLKKLGLLDKALESIESYINIIKEENNDKTNYEDDISFFGKM